MNGLSLISEASITSRDIAELVDSRHPDVMRSIQRLAKAGTIRLPPVAFSERINNLGHPVQVEHYLFTGEQGKRDSIIVVAQLSPEFTARLVDRWRDLENKIASFDPVRFLADPAAMRGLLLTYTERVIELEHTVAEQAPKVEFHDKVVVAPDAISVAEAAKTLGTGRNRLMAELRQMRWLTRRNEPYQEKINNGWLDVKISRMWDQPNQGLKRSLTPLVTGKGLAKLQSLGIGQPSA